MADIDQVFEAVQAVDKKVDKLCKWQGAVEERCQNRERQADGIKKTVYGEDGRGGLVSDVKGLKNGVVSGGKWRSFLLGVAKTVVSALIISVIMWLVLFYKQH